LNIIVVSGVRYEANNSLMSIGSFFHCFFFFFFVFLVCIEDDSFNGYHRLHTPNDSNTSPGTPFIHVVSVSIDDYFAIVNCSTPDHVPHHKLDWYFKTSSSLKSPRVIWQRGRSIIHRYTAYSPDQIRHYLQIKPVHHNDSGTYICLDQTTGYQVLVDLVVRKFISTWKTNNRSIDDSQQEDIDCVIHSLNSVLTRERERESE
jgi:hypothetical protein